MAHSWVSLALACLFIHSLAHTTRAESSTAADSLDAFLRDSVRQALARGRAGVARAVPVPANLSGIEASVVSLKTSTLRSRGASFNGVLIPPNATKEMPRAQRLMFVYQNLRNWSDSYYALPGHKFMTPVIGFLAYDASKKIEINVTGHPIAIAFENFLLGDLRMRCVQFRIDGSTCIGELGGGGGGGGRNACLANDRGHFAIVVPMAEAGKERWEVWVVVVGGVGWFWLGWVY
ncbi:hypothetical protein QJS10_CPB22g00077 [Acorus calamus]|uniref:Uncharacterized protein n=1 Tax=Acorus calamus TaxID=4465 RepID=A0AAV9BYK4_ACOCL|nr:hypothetical protein QJS10_CPB22g00077 [Acorus calamus]